MKRIFLFVFSIVLALNVVGVAFAEECNTEAYTISCVKGMVIKESGYLPFGYGITPSEDIALVVCSGSRAVLQKGEDQGFVNVFGDTRITVGQSIYVDEGLIAIVTYDNEISLETGTQTACIAPESMVVVRVDDYGNAFNYCVEGNVELYSKLNKTTMTLNTSEYIAVTVKRGFRILKETSLEQIKELGADFDEVIVDIEAIDDFVGYGEIASDFSAEGEIAKVTDNTAYVLRHSDGSFVTGVLFVDCPQGDAVLSVYDTRLSKVGSSYLAPNSNMPNVTVVAEKEDERYIVCVYFSKKDELTLKRNEYQGMVGQVFGIFRRFAIPLVGAIVMFVIYEYIIKRFIKRPKF